jgi:uncharacterized repeat protein (TIGR03803 family)
MIALNHIRDLAVGPRAGRFDVLLMLPVLTAAFGLIPAGRVAAQTFQTLHSFSTAPGGGTYPNGLILSGNTLYGTTEQGSSSGNGTVFKLNTDGTAFGMLYSFTGPFYDGNSNVTNSDGAWPEGALFLSGNALYGTAAHGGSSGNGTIFKINTDGTGFTNLHSFAAGSFTNGDGTSPFGGLILTNNTLYGTASGGGNGGNGTVFALNADGTGFRVLHSFTRFRFTDPVAPNGDGASPNGGLMLSGETLYGTASQGGEGGAGTVFKVNTDGSGFATLYTFTGGLFSYTNSDGAFPTGMILLSNTLYGTASRGGAYDNGTMFAINADGTGFTALYFFSGGSDGANPNGGLQMLGNNLYGTAGGGGRFDKGTVFAINTNGTGFATLHSFSGGSDGAYPNAGLMLSGNAFYGTTGSQYNSYNGTVFALSFPPPQLTITASGANILLTWPTNYSGFEYTGITLQSTTNLISPVWTTNSQAFFVVNGQNAVTNLIYGTQQFFRLNQ